MSYARDKLYKGYLLKKMPAIVSTVKTREIVPHLSCLTDHDRENIEAKRDTCGNYDSMVLLLDCLKRRENWPEQFIAALEACDHQTLADEIRAEYAALRGTNNSSPSCPPTTVIRAHVHPAPSASHLSIPESAGNTPAAQAASPPPDIAARPQAPQHPEAEAAEIEVKPAPSTPPPSPETPHNQAAQREIASHQEPVENSESDNQDVSGENGVSAGSDEASLSCVDTPHPEPAQSPPPAQVNSDVTDGSSFPTMTPEKPPVQDTSPVEDLQPAAAVQPEETSEPAVTQAAAVVAASLFDDALCLSKPGELISVQPQSHGTISARSSPEEPYSGNSERLEISEAASDAPACSVTSSTITTTTLDTTSALPCQENGIPLNHNEPEENQYDSPGQSLDMQEVRMNVLQISEEPSILNLDGHSSAAQIVNGEEAPSAPPAPPTNAAGTVSSINTDDPSEPAPGQKTRRDSEDASSRALPANTKYILTAAGVGACALLMAWKFKN
ncbi:Mitochondrial antiviral-signaling protein [Nibea albiflora]|uniref:Mitochondrial antiviral-signaling protein n=1 Tax=Nibea albiflora TaxID=240163 RepID=A0ACB7FFP1_NIBAL|nr:Mitochondrial antiviral-signaling protein [Nibea albiflora]